MGSAELAPLVEESGAEANELGEQTHRSQQILVPVKPLLLLSLLVACVILVWAFLAMAQGSTTLSQKLQSIQKDDWMCNWPGMCYFYTTPAPRSAAHAVARRCRHTYL